MYKSKRKYCGTQRLNQCLVEYLTRKVPKMIILIFSFHFSQDVSLFPCPFFCVFVTNVVRKKVNGKYITCTIAVHSETEWGTISHFFLWLAWSSLLKCLCNPNPVNYSYVTTIFLPPVCVCCSAKEKTKANTSSQNFTKKLTWRNFLTV